MEPQNEIIKGVFAMLDAQLTSKEFDEQIERHRFLSEVKAKKFTRLEALGIIQKNAKRPAGSHIPKEEKKHIAVTGYAMVTELRECLLCRSQCRGQAKKKAWMKGMMISMEVV